MKTPVTIQRRAPEGNLLANADYLAELQQEMLRFALLQLGKREEAEDAVQEALAGALKNAGGFRAEAALKTWVIAILKNKVADILRHRRRAPLTSSELSRDLGEDGTSDLFDRRGMWRQENRPARWEDPEADLHSRQFLAVFDACLNRLPPQQARVFLMREVIDLDTSDICEELGLSANNIHVILHRARLALRVCIERNWIKPGAGPC